MIDLFPGLDVARATRALKELEEAGREAREFFDAGHYDAAQMEVDRCRRAVRVLDEIRREQKRRA
jgi:hypothetical protein